MILNNKAYNFLKYFTTIFLPATGALYYGLTEVWGFDRTLPVNATINTVVAFLGVTLGLSTRKYNKVTGGEDSFDGDLVVSEVDGEKYLALGVNGSVEQMQAKTEVRLRVVEK
jgi:hypothetical protein